MLITRINHFFRSSPLLLFSVMFLMFIPFVQATQLTNVSIIDKEIILVTFVDGDVLFRDDATGASAYLTANDATENSTVLFGNPLNISMASMVSTWTIRSNDDAFYGSSGRSPQACYRKSKIHAMAQNNWNMSLNDFNYDAPMQHQIF